MPYMDPDVTAVKKNSDGTVTLTIDVICLEKSNDRAFTHELTLRELGGGKVQYAANAIVPDEHNVMPNYVYRLQ